MYFLRFLSIFSLIALLACSKKDKPEAAYSKQNLPEHESYRFYLWQLLYYSNWDFDFVGTRQDSFFYPGIEDFLFDRNHQGISGIQTTGVINNMDFVLTHIPTPDVVLLGIGGNDLVGGGKQPLETIENIKIIINKFQAKNPNITILLEQIAPIEENSRFNGLLTKIKEFNSNIPELAQNQSTATSKVIVVDMYSRWQKNYFADEVHYSKKGAKEIARRYFKQLARNLKPGGHYRILPIGDSRAAGLKLAKHDNLEFTLELF